MAWIILSMANMLTTFDHAGADAEDGGEKLESDSFSIL